MILTINGGMTIMTGDDRQVVTIIAMITHMDMKMMSIGIIGAVEAVAVIVTEGDVAMDGAVRGIVREDGTGVLMIM